MEKKKNPCPRLCRCSWSAAESAAAWQRSTKRPEQNGTMTWRTAIPCTGALTIRTRFRPRRTHWSVFSALLLLTVNNGRCGILCAQLMTVKTDSWENKRDKKAVRSLCEKVYYKIFTHRILFNGRNVENTSQVLLSIIYIFTAAAAAAAYPLPPAAVQGSWATLRWSRRARTVACCFYHHPTHSKHYIWTSAQSGSSRPRPRRRRRSQNSFCGNLRLEGRIAPQECCHLSTSSPCYGPIDLRFYHIHYHFRHHRQLPLPLRQLLLNTQLTTAEPVSKWRVVCPRSKKNRSELTPRLKDSWKRTKGMRDGNSNCFSWVRKTYKQPSCKKSTESLSSPPSSSLSCQFKWYTMVPSLQTFKFYWFLGAPQKFLQIPDDPRHRYRVY